MKRPRKTAKKLRSLNTKKSAPTVKGGSAFIKTKHDTAKNAINNIK
jgi:hypothetical protein